MSKFKIKLLTSRVSATESNAAGDVIVVGNDEAWRMIQAGTGLLASKEKPTVPAREQDELDAAQKIKDDAAAAASAEQVEVDSQQVIAELTEKNALLTEQNQLLADEKTLLLEELAALKPPVESSNSEGAVTDSLPKGEQE